MDDEEQPLAGGMDPAHAVVRVGDTVRRPPRRSSDAVRALLLHLERVGFEGAPRHLGRDEQGRDVLSFIPGEVPLPPYPAWSMTDAAIVELGRLLRRLHEAVASFDIDGVDGWEDDWADPLGGRLVCHNDVFPENVVFRDGLPVAFIDFDMAGPGRPFWDVAIAASEWAPLKAPAARLAHPPELDGVARLALLAGGYGVAPEQAEDLVAAIGEEFEHADANVRSEVAAGYPMWVEHWRETDGESRSQADRAWLAAHREALVASIRRCVW